MMEGGREGEEGREKDTAGEWEEEGREGGREGGGRERKGGRKDIAGEWEEEGREGGSKLDREEV